MCVTPGGRVAFSSSVSSSSPFARSVSMSRFSSAVKESNSDVISTRGLALVFLNTISLPVWQGTWFCSEFGTEVLVFLRTSYCFDLDSQPLPFHGLPRYIPASTLISIPFGSRPGAAPGLEDLQIRILLDVRILELIGK